MLIGKTGIGKTHLLYAMKNALYSQLNKENQAIWDKAETQSQCNYLTPMFAVKTSIDIIHQIKTGIAKNTSDEVIWSFQILECLMIDDWGNEKQTDWVAEQQFLILDYRLQNCKPTVISSNLTLDEIAQVSGERIASRMCELCRVIKLEGKDRRIK
jgi:DNA replication protein DnaC